MTPTEAEDRAMAATATARIRAGAVIPAAGQARRFGSGENKIWAAMAGHSVLEWTLAAFAAHPDIEGIVLAAGAEEMERVRSVASAFPKVIAVVAGGATRAASVQNGLEALPPDYDLALVHDAARPLLSAEVLSRVLAATAEHGAAVPGLPLSDTVKRMDSGGRVRATIPRSAVVDGETVAGLTAVQTPQGARVELLRAAYAAFDFAHAEPTDEASLLEAYGAPVVVVPGDPTNIKITRAEDIALAEALLAARRSPAMEKSFDTRTGFGYDVHRFAAPETGRKLFLGGVEIPHDRGLDGHSDADVLLHAVCDALLGAVSLGDIGILFPNTDPAYKGISSLKLLSIVGQRLAEAGWETVNLDATVVAEAPKLMPHREKIGQAIAACLGLDASRISVKATTSEKMGFVGRQEGIACWAVATVRKPAP
ncbi:MAG TPA: 2-C-methyl-D-erythritol 4-phosphate cytidylyltransferase [Chthonomonadaceae bacterium]|nr:2-C-methyl-D-erythritol 4-phosphate cytidylyltransferase [Chthonomonadaceae bacterium]